MLLGVKLEEKKGSHEEIFKIHKGIKKRFDEKNLGIRFDVVDKKHCCIVSQDHYKFGIPGETKELAFLEAARWILNLK